jgi:hypothetical protein
MNMKIQEQIINNENGTEYWKIYFEILNEKQLSLLEYGIINNQINKLISEFNEQRNKTNCSGVVR